MSSLYANKLDNAQRASRFSYSIPVSVLIFLISLTGFGYLYIDQYRGVMALLFFLVVIITGGRNKNSYIGSIFRSYRMLFILFTALIAVSSRWSFDVSKTVNMAIFYILFCLVLMLEFSNSFSQKIINAIKITAIFEALTVILSVVMGRSFLSVFGFLYRDIDGVWRVLQQGIGTGITGAPAYAAFVIDLGVGFYVSKIFIRRRLEYKEWIGLITCLLGILATGKRTIIIEIVIVSLIMLVLSIDQKRYRTFLKYGFGVLVIAILAILFIPQVQITVARFLMMSGDSTMNSRTLFWSQAISIFQDNKLLGCGFASFSTYDLMYGTKFGYAAHNIYLEILAELGIVGAIIFSLFSISIIILSCKCLRNSRMLSIDNNAMTIHFAFYGIFSYLLYGIMENVLYCFSIQFLFMISLCLMLSSYTSIQNNKRRIRITIGTR